MLDEAPGLVDLAAFEGPVEKWKTAVRGCGLAATNSVTDLM